MVGSSGATNECNHSCGNFFSSSAEVFVVTRRRCSHFGGGVFDDKYLTVVNSSYYTTWYCGLTSPVLRFKTSATDRAWHGKCPR